MQDLFGEGRWTHIEPIVANNIGPLRKMTFVNVGSKQYCQQNPNVGPTIWEVFYFRVIQHDYV